VATIYDYVMAVWLRIELRQPAPGFEDELHEHLLEAGFQVNQLEVIAEDDGAEDEIAVSLRVQLTLDESQMDGDEPTAQAVAEFDEELRTCLSSKYEVNYLDVMDDALTSFLIAKRDEPDPRKYPEAKQRDLTETEKTELRARIELGDADIYALASEYGCSASQVAASRPPCTDDPAGRPEMHVAQKPVDHRT
jgi:hypothetical protein